jgi:PhnB protein
MKTVHPYLNFAGNTEEAFAFYRSVFGGEYTNVTRFSDMDSNEMRIPDAELDRIANIGLPLTKDITLMGTDVVSTWGPLTAGNSTYIALETESDEETERLFAGLSAGGSVRVPPHRTDWAARYADFIDRYGVQWMVMNE